MTRSTALELGRTAVEERRWAEAYERLTEADSAEGLSARDLEQLATTTSLRGDTTAQSMC